MKRGKRIIGVISAGLIGVGTVFGTNMIAGGDMFGVNEVQAAEDDVVVLDEKWLNYDDNKDGTCTITDFNYIAGSSPSKIEIPATIGKDNLVIKKIGDGAFQGCGLTYVRFDENSSITEIGNNAFRGNNINTLEANGEGDANSLPKAIFVPNMVPAPISPADITPIILFPLFIV